MKEIAVQFSITNSPLLAATKPTMARRRKNSIPPTAPRDVFSHSRRSHQMQYTTVLPIISLSSMSDFKEKLVRMASNNKSMKQPTTPSPVLTEFRLKTPSTDMPQFRSRVASSNRLPASNIPKSSLSYPTIVPRPNTGHRVNQHLQQQQPSPTGARFFCVVNPSASSQRIPSARLIHPNNLTTLPLHQQPQLLASPLLPRPHPQYGHFLAYLRRQSLARMRRKQQQQEEGCSDTVETIITFSSSRPSPSLSHSISNLSMRSPSPDTSSMPTISMQTKRKNRPIPSQRVLQRAASSLPINYRLKLNQTPPPPPLRHPPPTPSPRLFSIKPSDELPILAPQRNVLITPANSIVDEAIVFPSQKPTYELQLTGDMLNYCYVSDSGVKYQGQLLSSPV